MTRTVMELLDFSDFYTGWSACYSNFLINVDREAVEECVYWPWLPVIIGNAILISAEETMYIVFNFYASDVAAQKKERAKFKMRKSYEDAAAKHMSWESPETSLRPV